jgi:hypothetical protein
MKTFAIFFAGFLMGAATIIGFIYLVAKVKP